MQSLDGLYLLVTLETATNLLWVQPVHRGAAGRCCRALGAFASHQGAGNESAAGREGVTVQPEQADLEPTGGANAGEQPAAGIAPFTPSIADIPFIMVSDSQTWKLQKYVVI